MPETVSMMNLYKMDVSINDPRIAKDINYIFVSGCGLDDIQGDALNISSPTFPTPNYFGKQKLQYTIRIAESVNTPEKCNFYMWMNNYNLVGTTKTGEPFDKPSGMTSYDGQGNVYHYIVQEIVLIQKNFTRLPVYVRMDLPDSNGAKWQKDGMDEQHPSNGNAVASFDYQCTKNDQGSCTSPSYSYSLNLYISRSGGKYNTLSDEVTDRLRSTGMVDLPDIPVDKSVLAALGATDGVYRKKVEVYPYSDTIENAATSTWFIIKYNTLTMEFRVTRGNIVEKGQENAALDKEVNYELGQLKSIQFIPFGSSLTGDEAKVVVKKDYNGTVTENKTNVSCETDSDCGIGKFCNACNICVDKPLINPNDVVLSYEMTPQLSSSSIKNIIKESSVLRVPIKVGMKDKDGKDIDACSIASPGLGSRLRLEAAINDTEVYSGFTMGNILDKRENKDTCNIDTTKKDFKCVFVIAPNDRKKSIEEVGDITQNITLRLLDNGKAVKEQLVQLTLQKIDMDINIDTATTQVQQGQMKSLQLMTKDDDAKILLIKGALMGPGKLFQLTGKTEGGAADAASKATGRIAFTAKPGDDIQIGYQAPEMGNFDIGQAISTLSMWDLQKAAGKQIAKDAILNYAGEYVGTQVKSAQAYAEGEQKSLQAYQSASKSFGQYYDPARALNYVRNVNDANQYAQEFETLGKTFLAVRKTPDIVTMPDKIKKLQSNVQTNVNDAGDASVNWKERYSNYGITAINLAQTTVGVLTFIPNKIPGVNKLSAGLKTAFSAASNIVKADLQYVAQAEKIDRAQEIIYPVPMVVTVEDENGWGMTAFLVIKVAYQEV